MIVEFRTVEEFCEELTKEQPNLLGPAVRVTNQITPSTLSPSINHLAVVATFATAMPTGDICVTRLLSYCGDLWNNDHIDAEVRAKAKKTSGAIEELCHKLGLEVRAGIIKQDRPWEVQHAN